MEAVLSLAASPELRGDLGLVGSVRLRGSRKELTTNSGSLLVPRFAIAGRGTHLVVDGRGVHVPTRMGNARLLPSYSRQTVVDLGGRSFRVVVKEPDEPFELEAHDHLSDLHYRGERGFGRKGVLVMVAAAPDLPRVLGYVEVTTGFLMNSPRTRLLDSPFRGREIAWKAWGAREMSQLTSAIARVSRVVVHPEIRGQGLGRVLMGHAFAYARSHFHAGGLRPVFVEMTADMTKYVPFAEAAGMHFIGYTEGNLHRVAKDMRYLQSRPDLLEMPTDTLKARGIMQAQRRYASGVATVSSGRSLDDVALAARVGGSGLDSETYAAFHGVLRLPKPTYLTGLTPRAGEFVERRLRELGVSDPTRYVPSPVTPIVGPISIERLSIGYRSTVKRTDRSTSVQEAFGIKPEAFDSPVVTDLDLTIPSGDICLVYGPSGSGKTTLLNLLSDGSLPPAAQVKGRVAIPEGARIGRFQDLPASDPLVEVVAAGQSTAAAIHALNMAGLSDAKLYLRRYAELSNGQRYRAMLASLMASSSNVWIADEFLSTLDPTTASIVAANIARHVRATGVTLVVGAPHFSYFLEPLRPDLVLELVSPWESRLSTGAEFALRRRHRGRGVAH